jgi:hypothetical protein
VGGTGRKRPQQKARLLRRRTLDILYQMHGSHDHHHTHARTAPAGAGVSLLRLSAAARMSIAAALSLVIWLIVFAVLR